MASTRKNRVKAQIFAKAKICALTRLTILYVSGDCKGLSKNLKNLKLSSPARPSPSCNWPPYSPSAHPELYPHPLILNLLKDGQTVDKENR